MDPVLMGPIYLIALAVAGFATASIVRRAQAQRRAQRRVVEQPNSHYTAKAVRDRERRDVWHTIELERVHEINRGEVVRLLDKVDAVGIDSLKPAERIFLDQMVHLAGPDPA